MSRSLEKAVHALRMKQSRVEDNQKKANAEVWERIEQLEQLIAQENSGVDAAQELSPSAQLLLHQAAQRRGWNKAPK
ncbi:hypothetical protein MKJ01_05420 [Chryseobacterium sp. SSA4.19]|uniref:hypothetical protein n=1 Tax=Chryseobacterium sp. SSA4.19 TaxID=2919915 RepID=UPI001F4EE30B|nr:hypothetical protein [Chryseobacterium sp. SSA4.19]MCJ8153200.1 hypothetical protein [Chryseobacterium sp. SSA4.19]